MLRTALPRRPALRLTSTTLWNSTRNIHDRKVPDSETPHTTTDSSSTPSELPDSGTHDLASVKQLLHDWSGRVAITIRNRADDFTETTKSRFSQLGSHLNKVSGYEEIEALKKQVVAQEARINATRQASRQAKLAYQKAVVRWSNSQRDVNDMLQRKSTWTDEDISRFTVLVREDHGFEQEEARAKAAVDETEDAVEREFSELMRSILGRYHEEQVWSDKIRSVSTYGQMAALGLNLFVFIMAIVVVEPWKRRRLAQTFEKKIDEMSKENAAMVDEGIKGISRQLEEQARLFSASVEVGPFPAESRTPESVDAEHALHANNVTRVELGLLASGAVAAGTVGWLARSWFGR